MSEANLIGLVEQLDPPFEQAFKVYDKNNNDPDWDVIEGKDHSYDLSLDYPLSGLDLHGEFTVTNNAVPGLPVPRAVNPAELLKKIELSFNGKDSIQAFNGLECAMMSAWEREGAPVEMRGIDSTAARASGALNTVSALWHLDFNSFGFDPEHHGLIQAPLLNSGTLKVSFGNGGDLVDGADNNPVVTGTLRLQRRGVLHETNIARGFGLRRKTVIEKHPTGAQRAYPIKLNKGTNYERIFIVTTAGADGVLSDAPLTGEVKVSVGGTVAFRADVTTIRAKNREWWGASGFGQGVCVIDFIRAERAMAHRSAAALLEVGANDGDVLLELDVAGVANDVIRVIPVEAVGVTAGAAMLGLPQVG